jgi:hypothetical protein
LFTTFLNPFTNKMVTVVPTMLRDGVAGFSKDGSKIYIDVLAPMWQWAPYIAHECTEELFELELGFKHDYAHMQATIQERRVVESLGIDWKYHDDTFHQVLDMILKRDPLPPNPSDLHISH